MATEVGPTKNRYRPAVRPLVKWMDPPNPSSAPIPDVDWGWVAALLAGRPGHWLRVANPVPGRPWERSWAGHVPNLAAFRPRDSHEAKVVDGELYLRRLEPETGELG